MPSWTIPSSSPSLASGDSRKVIEDYLGRKINDQEHDMLMRAVYAEASANKDEYANGIFQFCTTNDPIVYHTDTQNYAGLIFLSPNAPLSTGTATYKSKVTGVRKFDKTNYSDELFKKTFSI